MTENCWELLSCSKVLCPSYGKHTDCWLTAGTLGDGISHNDFFEKISRCLICPYFQKKSESWGGGWNDFIADQLRKYNFKALESLYQKEESFIEILNLIPDGLFTTDKEWRITFFNPAAEKITKFSAADAVGMCCKDVFKNEICETDCALKRAMIEGGVIHNRECKITNAEGNVIPIICSTAAFFDHTGKITGGLEIFKDITESKQLREKIARREKKYARMFEGSNDMIYVTNPKGDILDVNPAGIAMLGYRDKSDLMSIGSAYGFYKNPLNRQKVIDSLMRYGYIKDFEVDFKKRDGSPIHVLISGRRYENPETGDIEIEGIIKDISHRKFIEEIIKQRNWELSVLHRIALALNLTIDLDQILTIALNSVLEVLRLSGGALFLIDREQKKAVIRSRRKLPPPDPDYSIIFKDIMLQQYLIDEGGIFTPKGTFPSFKVKYDSAESVPWLHAFLITSKGRSVGFFGLDIPSNHLSLHETHLMGSLGNFLGGAIENAQLVKTVGQHRQELRKLTEKLFQTQEDERQRIARELHDEAGQALTAVNLSLERLEEKVATGKTDIIENISDIRKMINHTSGEIRRISYRLHPTLLSDLGLEPALRLYFKETEKRSNLEITFNMIGFDERLDRNMETVLYRFSQETLTNTLKHSGAEHFHLSIIKGYPKIIFTAEDDGIGFDGEIGHGNRISLGLLGMRERTYLLGGSFQLRSRPRKGTRIRIEIPFVETASYGKTN